MWRAWHDLDSGRQWVGTFGPPLPRRLSWADIRRWAVDNLLTAQEAVDLHHLLGEMEQEFAAIQAELRAAAT